MTFTACRQLGLHKLSLEHLDVPLYTILYAAVMTQERYERFDTRVRSVLDDMSSLETGLGPRIAKLWDRHDADARSAMLAAGARIYVPSTDELVSWNDVAVNVKQRWVGHLQRLGLPGQAILSTAEDAALRKSLAR
jgi:hypothetical protein